MYNPDGSVVVAAEQSTKPRGSTQFRKPVVVHVDSDGEEETKGDQLERGQV